MSAKYIFRLDDATAYLNPAKWNLIEKIFDEHNIYPIVAVTPDNKDEELMYHSMDSNFWEKVRKWDKKGWNIAMHGYQHLYHPSNKKDSIVPFYNRSEFTGLSLEIQREKIRSSLALFYRNNIEPKIWIAPSHSFDKNTLKALEAETDIKIVSDGIAIYPYRYEGMNYIPQQLWDIKLKSIGIWTICLHPDTMTMDQITDLQEKLKDTRISNNLILINDVVFQSDQKNLINFFYKLYFLFRFRISRYFSLLKDIVTRIFRR